MRISNVNYKASVNINMHLLFLGYTVDKLHHETVEERQSIGLSWHLRKVQKGCLIDKKMNHVLGKYAK